MLVDAQQQHALVALAGHQPPPDELWDVGFEEVRLALRLSHIGTRRRLELARALTSTHTATLDALEAGQITWPHARTIVEGTEGLDVEAVAAVEQAVLGRAAEQTVANLRRSVRRAVLRVRPHQAAEEHEQARVRDLLTIAHDRCWTPGGLQPARLPGRARPQGQPP